MAISSDFINNYQKKFQELLSINNTINIQLNFYTL